MVQTKFLYETTFIFSIQSHNILFTNNILYNLYNFYTLHKYILQLLYDPYISLEDSLKKGPSIINNNHYSEWKCPISFMIKVDKVVNKAWFGKSYTIINLDRVPNNYTKVAQTPYSIYCWSYLW